MKKDLKTPKNYYLLGSIILVLGILLLVLFLTLPLIDKTKSYLGWISFAGVIITCPIFFYSFYLLKKANFIKLQNTNKEIDEIKDKEE